MSKSFNLYGIAETSYAFLKNGTVGQLSATDFKLGIKGANDKFSIQGTVGVGPTKLINESMPQLKSSLSISGNIKSHYQINENYGASIYLDGRHYSNAYYNVSKKRIDNGQEFIDSNAVWEYMHDNYNLTPEEIESMDPNGYNFFNNLNNDPIEVKTYKQSEEYYNQSINVASVGVEVDRSVKNFNFGVGLEGRYMKLYDSKTNIDQTVKSDPLYGSKLLSYDEQRNKNENSKLSVIPTARVSYNIPLFGGKCGVSANLNAKLDQVIVGGAFTFY